MNKPDFIDDYEDELYPPKKEAEIQIPDFLTNKVIPTEEGIREEVVANNVPYNTKLEKIKDLEELERVCQNWSKEEWERVILHANSHLMFAELDRRAEEYENSISVIRGNLESLSGKKL